MIPKALLHGARAAANAQQLSSASFRNVFQLPTLQSGQIVNGPSVASSNWGSGGSQQFAYQGYTGVGRAITQANSSTNDPGREQSDDTEEHKHKLILVRSPGYPTSPTLQAGRGRRNSFTGIRTLTTQPSGVLAAVRQQKFSARARLLASHAPAGELAQNDSSVASSTRRHSTASELSVGDASADTGVYMLVQTEPENLPSDGAGVVAAERLYAEVVSARLSKDRDQILKLVEAHDLRSSSGRDFASGPLYNLILLSLAELHPAETPLTAVIDFYNVMLAADYIPDASTHCAVLDLLLLRDAEALQYRSAAHERAMRFGVGMMGGTDLEGCRDDVLNERNYESAVTLFDAGLSIAKNPFTSAILIRMIDACAARGDVATALRVFSHAERSVGHLGAQFHASLIKAHRVAGNLEGCRKVFAEHTWAGDTAKDLPARFTDPNTSFDVHQEVQDPLQSPTIVFEEMIAAYIHFGHPDLAMELLESMIDQGTTEGRTPTPTFTTYATIVRSFCEVMDVESALLWFGKLGRCSLDSSAIWRDVFYALAESGAIKDLNHHVKSIISCSTPQPHALAPADVVAWLHCNGQQIVKLSPADQEDALSFIANNLEQVVPEPGVLSLIDERDVISGLQRLCDLAVHVNPTAAAFLMQVVARRLTTESRMVHADWKTWWSECASNLAPYIVDSPTVSPDIALRCVLDLCQVWVTIPGLDRPPFMWMLCSTYAHVSKDLVTRLDSEDWQLLLESFCQAERLAREHSRVGPDLSRLTGDLAQFGTEGVIDLSSFTHFISVLRECRGHEVPAALLSMYSSACDRTSPLTTTDPDIPSPPSPAMVAAHIQINANHSRSVDQHSSLQRSPPSPTPQVCFERYRKGAAVGVFPSPEVIGRLINALGRLKEVDEVQELYADFQWVLASLQNDRSAQSSAWFTVEDQMIAALAHSGHFEAANTHRLQMLHQGGVPCADSYGALIAAVKCTTDDCSLAQELFEEAVRLDVIPNSYLYNTVISKMAKARRTEYALGLFHRMPYLGLRPTPVTYAAVIGACCRVGDEESAVFLFDEMLRLPNYRPRVPVYNSMIQFFVSQRKDRDRALHYYQLLLDAGLGPSEHTYKLLLDAYGSIKPMDTAKLVSTFSEASAAFKPQGPLWASMINAWGCVGRDIQQVISLFDACEHSSPSTLPDALVYEAMFNALFANDRVDLVSSYLERMAISGVYMTAYIANVLIRGYSAAGDISRAREVFDSLVDPPLGVAAPHNHCATLAGRPVPPDAPVFREPSSWEAIINAELRFGEIDKARELMARLDARMFPPGVTSRVRALLYNAQPLQAGLHANV